MNPRTSDRLRKCSTTGLLHKLHSKLWIIGEKLNEIVFYFFKDCLIILLKIDSYHRQYTQPWFSLPSLLPGPTHLLSSISTPNLFPLQKRAGIQKMTAKQYKTRHNEMEIQWDCRRQSYRRKRVPSAGQRVRDTPVRRPTKHKAISHNTGIGSSTDP